jgi:hypothetical protein
VPLPADRNPTWPPPHWAQDQRQIEEARAWLVGNLHDLGTFYANKGNRRPGWRTKLIERMLKQEHEGKVDHNRLHVPLPRQIARTAASLLFSEGVSLQVPEAHQERTGPDGEELPPTPEQLVAQATEDRLQTLWDQGGWASILWQAAYVSSGEGGVWLRPTWDTAVSSMPILQVFHHNRAVPVFRSGQLVEVTLWRVLEVTADKKYLRHLEVYTPGQVQHALYRGSEDRLGDRLDLGASSATDEFARVADQDGVIDLAEYGIEGLLPEYVPNVLPNVVTLSSEVGSADTAGLEDQLFALDEADTGWHGDVRVGKRRIIVDESMLERHGRGGGADFDFDQEVFVGLHYGALNDNAKIEAIDFDIRSDQYESTVTNRFNRTCLAAGYNPESVTWSSTGEQMTATEVLARDALSADTTASKRRFFERAIVACAYKALLIDRFVFNSPLEPVYPEVVWPTGDDDTLKQTADLVNTLALAGAISTYEKVKRVNPDWSDDRVQQEVDRIRQDTGQAVPDPTDQAESRELPDPPEPPAV